MAISALEALRDFALRHGRSLTTQDVPNTPRCPLALVHPLTHVANRCVLNLGHSQPCAAYKVRDAVRTPRQSATVRLMQAIGKAAPGTSAAPSTIHICKGCLKVIDAAHPAAIGMHRFGCAVRREAYLQARGISPEMVARKLASLVETQRPPESIAEFELAMDDAARLARERKDRAGRPLPQIQDDNAIANAIREVPLAPLTQTKARDRVENDPAKVPSPIPPVRKSRKSALVPVPRSKPSKLSHPSRK